MIKKFKNFLNEGLNQFLKGPSIEEILRDNPIEVLIMGVENNDVDLVKKALDYGADINPTGDDSIFLNAIKNGNIEIIKLLDNKFNFTKLRHDKEWYLKYAIKNNQYDVVEYFFSIGFSITMIYDMKQEIMQDTKINDNIKELITKVSNIKRNYITEGLSTLLSLNELKEKYPQITFTMKLKGNNMYFVRADIETQGGKIEYLGALKGAVSEKQALEFLNNIANKNYDKYY